MYDNIIRLPSFYSYELLESADNSSDKFLLNFRKLSHQQRVKSFLQLQVVFYFLMRRYAPRKGLLKSSKTAFKRNLCYER